MFVGYDIILPLARGYIGSSQFAKRNHFILFTFIYFSILISHAKDLQVEEKT